MIFALAVIFFVFGLIVGSFLNVVILRFKTRSFSSLADRSFCMSCQRTLLWYELIPLLSFVALQGRCRTCQTRISMIYPFVESLTGIIFMLLFLKLHSILLFSLPAFFVTYMYYAVIFALLVVVALYDLRHKIIPDELSLTLGILTFLGLFFLNLDNLALHFHLPSILEFLSGILAALPFYLLWLVSSGRWMGLGDAKLAISLGWLLGLYNSLSMLLLAFSTGALVGIFLIIFSPKYGLKSEIPFAPYMIFATMFVFFFGFHILGV